MGILFFKAPAPEIMLLVNFIKKEKKEGSNLYGYGKIKLANKNFKDLKSTSDRIIYIYF